jgi:hypothetical protein
MDTDILSVIKELCISNEGCTTCQLGRDGKCMLGPPCSWDIDEVDAVIEELG